MGDNAIIVLLQYFLLIFKISAGVPPSPTDSMIDDIIGIKSSLKSVGNAIEKWGAVYNNQIEPRMVSSSNTIAGIDNNVRNLQERAHVWDTFQLHVSAWNDQLATTDRKLDIMSKGQEKLLNLDGKINFISNLEYKLEAIFKKLEETEESLSALTKKVEHAHHGDNLFGEFATRGILSTLKIIEKKLDRIQVSSQNIMAKQTKHNGEEGKGKLTIKCNTPPVVEELLQDVSSKVDVIFDKISEKDDVGVDDEEDEYLDDQQVGSGDNPKDFKTDGDVKLLRKILKRLNQPCKQTNKVLDAIYNKIKTIDNNTLLLVQNKSCKTHTTKIDQLFQILDGLIVNMTGKEEINLESHFIEQRRHFDQVLQNNLENKCPKSIDPPPINDSVSYIYANVSSCDALTNATSGVYALKRKNNETLLVAYCEMKSEHSWTVMQRRDAFPVLQNFSQSWEDYKHGFGQLDADFWLGNDLIHRLSSEEELILRIELEDFEGNSAWAEYAQFQVGPENENYRLLIGTYRGNASDSLSSHSNSSFSTYDRKNDDAPECCPCAPSYGGGWWFNSCFEANLNGVYHRDPNTNEYYRGIIWEHWLGNYSLKKSTMMVRLKTEEDDETFALAAVVTEKSSAGFPTTTLYPYIEDP